MPLPSTVRTTRDRVIAARREHPLPWRVWLEGPRGAADLVASFAAERLAVLYVAWQQPQCDGLLRVEYRPGGVPRGDPLDPVEALPCS